MKLVESLVMLIFQANLPGNVTERSLGEFFAKCGPIGTVKIMWRELSSASPSFAHESVEAP